MVEVHSSEDARKMQVRLYVNYCRLAALHDTHEAEYKQWAHEIFLQIQEEPRTSLRS